MIIFSEEIFSGYLQGTDNVYTDGRFSDMLGRAERLSFQAKVQQVSGSSPTLTIQIEHSPDGARWQDQAATAEVNATSISSEPAIEFDSATDVPQSAYVRLRITLGGSSPKAFLWINAAGRSPAD